MKNLDQLMKQAQQMQAKLVEAQKNMENIEFTGTAGGDMVQVVINGIGILKKVTIDPKLLDPNEGEIISDLIVAAYNDAKSKQDSAAAEQMSSFLPAGMKLPF